MNKGPKEKGMGIRAKRSSIKRSRVKWYKIGQDWQLGGNHDLQQSLENYKGFTQESDEPYDYRFKSYQNSLTLTNLWPMAKLPYNHVTL